MATKILGFGDAFRALAAESGTMRGHPMMNTSVHYAIESDEDAAVLQAEATQDAEEMTTDIAAANEAVELGDSANEAGDVFALAAVDESVPEAMIAQADTVAADVAEAGGVPLTTVLPDITDADRTMSEVSTESSTGRRIRRPMYGAIRQNKVGLQRCAESMWTSAKAMFSNAWEAILKAFRKFCQWVDKYIGTFPRLKMKVDSLIKDAKKLDGKKIKSGEAKLTVPSKNLAVPAAASKEVKYITKGKDLIDIVIDLREAVDLSVESQRKLEEEITDFVDILNGADFSSNDSAEKSFTEVSDDVEKLFETFEALAKKGSRMTEHDTAYGEAYSIKSLPGYQRLLLVIADKSKTTGGKDVSSITDGVGAMDIKCVDGDPKLKQTLKPDVQFETMGQNEIEQLGTELKKGIEEIITYRGSKQYLKNEAAIRRLKESTEKVDQRRSNTSTEDVDKHGRDVAKATVAIARAAMRMLSAPTRVITFFDTYTNFCIGLGRKSLAAYETR